MSWYSLPFRWFYGNTAGQPFRTQSVVTGPPPATRDPQPRSLPSRPTTTAGSGLRHERLLTESGNQVTPRTIFEPPTKPPQSYTHTTGSREQEATLYPASESESSDNDSNDSAEQRTKPVRRALAQDSEKPQPQSSSMFMVIEKRLTSRPTDAALSSADYAGSRTSTRRFVIIREPTRDDQTFEALSFTIALADQPSPIKTYNGLGVAAHGVFKAHHSVIYTLPLRSPAPHCTAAEQPQRGEQPMQTQAILVVGHDPTRPLDPMSRLDYFDRTRHVDVTNIRSYGMVDAPSIQVLIYQYQSVWASLERNTGRPFLQMQLSSGPVASPRASAPVDEALLAPGSSIRRTSGNTSAQRIDRTVQVQSDLPGLMRGSSVLPHAAPASRTNQSHVGPRAVPGNGGPRQGLEPVSPRAQALPPGQMSLYAMRTLIEDMVRRAETSGFSPPPTLTEAQMMVLARDKGIRDQFLARVRASWGAEPAARART
ncbi:hypothetical protein LTS10_005234 [Elasticomyces elasticus]|nr:hypothetical protein LTS10_005234 [Elasticomyces elasticus]